MTCRPWIVLAGAGILLTSTASADYRAAVQDYREGRLEAARSGFMSLADLGNGPSQYSLGAMWLRGEGGPRDKGTGVGWMLAAAENGYHGLPADRLAALRLQLGEEEQKAANGVLAAYGQQALQQTILPPADLGRTCPGFIPPRLLTPDPFFLELRKHVGVLVLGLTVGVDGRPRDPEVLTAIPLKELDASAIESLFQAKWAPAKLNGTAVESRSLLTLRFGDSSRGLDAHSQVVKELRAAADGGDPGGQYVLGLLTTLDIGLERQGTFDRNLLVTAAQGGHARAQYVVARRFEVLAPCAGRELTWLRHAAAAGDPAAQLVLAERALRASPAAEQVAQAVAWLEQAARSDDYYARRHALALFATSPLDTVRKPEVALAAAAELERGPVKGDPQTFEVIAAAFAANGDFPNAIPRQQIALKKARSLGWRTDFIEARLASYRDGKAWRGDLFAAP